MIQGSNNIRIIEPAQPEYPRRLIKAGVTVPIHIIGTSNLNAQHIVAIVGTRSATVYARDVITKIVKELAQRLDDIVIVSGLALGCDSMAHTASVDTGITTVGVMGHGLDTIYPSQNRNIANAMIRQGGALVSQFPLGYRINRGSFLERNKIIAALSDCVIIAESAADHGGALHTARHARQLGREVFAVPGRIGDKYSGGCNMLIEENTARIFTGVDTLIRIMDWKGKECQPELPGLDVKAPQGQAAEVVRYLQNHGGEQTADNISTALGIATGAMLALLIEMEFDGYISALPGNRFRLCNVI